MPTRSTLTEQLALLGVHLPAWPEEQDGDDPGNWLQRGQAYAEGVRLWRAQLRSAPESTKGVVDLLLRHLSEADQLATWDQLAYAAIKPELQGSPDYERWQTCTKLIRASDLTPAQLLGYGIDMASKEGLRNLLDIARSIIKVSAQEQALDAIAEILIAYIEARGDEPAAATNNFLSRISELECMTRVIRIIIESHGIDPDDSESINEDTPNGKNYSRAQQILDILHRESVKLLFQDVSRPPRESKEQKLLPESTEYFVFNELDLAMNKDEATAYHIKESSPKLQRLAQYIADNAKVIVDCGAHVGMFSALAAAKNPDATFYLFEPNIEVADYIDFNMPTRSRYCVYHAGVGAFNGKNVFFKSNQSSQTSSFDEKATIHFSRNAGVTKESLPICLLSDFLLLVGEEIDFLKIDIQGMEMDVIQDLMKADLLRRIKTIAIESSFLDSRSIECVDCIRQTGQYNQAYFVNPVYGGGDIVFSKLDFTSTARDQNAYPLI